MPSVCSLCRRPDRSGIDAALVEGSAPLRTTAARFGTSVATLIRHREHLPRALVSAATKQEEAAAETLVGKVQDLEKDARRLRAAAEEGGDLRAALAAIKVLADLCELWERIRETERLTAGPQKVIVEYVNDWRDLSIETNRGGRYQ